MNFSHIGSIHSDSETFLGHLAIVSKIVALDSYCASKQPPNPILMFCSLCCVDLAVNPNLSVHHVIVAAFLSCNNNIIGTFLGVQ